MNTKEAWALVGGLSKPSKMPGWAIGIPAAECKTGNKLKLIPNSVCSGCYAEGLLCFRGCTSRAIQAPEGNSSPAMGRSDGNTDQQQEAGCF